KNNSYKKEHDVLEDITNCLPTSSTSNFTLSDEQKLVHSTIIKNRESTFITGSGGTGKSALLSKIVSDLKNIYGDNRVAITATTGIAAVSINGKTLHSFTGIGLGDEPINDIIQKIRDSRLYYTRWRTMKTLIIDEISMLDGRLFDKLEEIGRAICENNRPFGGILLILTGDFFQLPLVAKDAIFCFEAKSWNDCVKHTIVLTKIFRQRNIAKDYQPEKDGKLQELVSSCLAPNILELKHEQEEVTDINNLLPIVKFTSNKEEIIDLTEWKLTIDEIVVARQTYVALSRTRSLDSLQVINFRVDKVMVDEQVKKFYEELEVYQFNSVNNSGCSDDNNENENHVVSDNSEVVLNHDKSSSASSSIPKPIYKIKAEIFDLLLPKVKELGYRNSMAKQIVFYLLETGELQKLTNSINDDENFKEKIFTAHRAVCDKVFEIITLAENM
ncbi:8159_t:CDS:10, partial [Entrophospora sp. SA101]